MFRAQYGSAGGWPAPLFDATEVIFFMSKLNLFHVLLLLILTPLIRFPSYVQALLAAACTGISPRANMAIGVGLHTNALHVVLTLRIRFDYMCCESMSPSDSHVRWPSDCFSRISESWQSACAQPTVRCYSVALRGAQHREKLDQPYQTIGLLSKH